MVFEKCEKGLPPLKRTKLSKKAKERDDLIKNRNFQSNWWWNDWKFQLHWNMLEWVDPKSTPKRVEPFSVSSKELYIYNNDRTAHSVFFYKNQQYPMVSIYNDHQIHFDLEI